MNREITIPFPVILTILLVIAAQFVGGGVPLPISQTAPVGVDGFRVLIVYEQEDRHTWPQSQQDILYSKELRDYLSAKCVKVDGQPEWRFWDQNMDLTNVSDVWKQYMDVDRDSLPWLVYGDGKKGGSVPLPESDTAVLELVRKVGG